MSQPNITIPIEHISAVHFIETSATEEPQPVTLLELIDAVSEVSGSEQEVLATVWFMINSGRIRLAGNFRDTPVAKLCG